MWETLYALFFAASMLFLFSKSNEIIEQNKIEIWGKIFIWNRKNKPILYICTAFESKNLIQ